MNFEVYFPNKKEIVHYRFAPGDGFAYRGLEYSYLRSEEEGYLLQRVDNNIVVAFTREQMTAMFEARLDPMQHFPGRYSPERPKPKWYETVTSNLTGKQKRKLVFKLDLLRAISKLIYEGRVSRTDEGIDLVLPGIIKKLARVIPVDGKKRLTYNGKKKMTKEVWEPAGSTVRKWLTLFERTGDPIVLLDNYGRTAGRKFLHPEVEVLVQEYARRWASPQERPDATDLHSELCEEIEKLNEGRGERDKLNLPCVETLRARIRELPPAMRALRLGPGAAELEFAADRGGTERLRPLERVEQDEWMVDLKVLLTIVGVWQTMSKKERMAVPRIRLWVTAIIDVASKCIIAADVHARDPSLTTAIPALDMATRDKTSLARDLGCSASWHYHGSFEEIAVDSAAWFTSDEFRVAVILLGANCLFPPTGAASGRGTVERFFRNMSEKALVYFSGRTWGLAEGHNTKEAEKEASLVAEQARAAILRFIVDVYHHTPHDDGETPHAAWTRLTRRYGVIPSPTGNRRRAILGTRTQVTIRAEGVTWRGVPYQGNALQHVRRNRTRKILLSGDLENLGEASFFDGRDWYTVRSKYPEFEGMTMLEWTALCDAFRAAGIEQAELSRDTVRKAHADLREIGRLPRIVAGVVPPYISMEDYEKFDRRMATKYTVATRGADARVNLAEWRPSQDYLDILGLGNMVLPPGCFDHPEGCPIAEAKQIEAEQRPPATKAVHAPEFDT